MRPLLHLALFTVVALLLSSCLPEERIWWSPRGDRAIVLLKDRLRLVDAQGDFIGAVEEDLSKEDALIKSVGWLPDGSGVVCQRVRKVATWDEARQLAPKAEVDAVDKMMPGVLPFLEAAVKLSTQSGSLDGFMESLPTKDHERFEIALRRSYQQDPAPIEALLDQLPKAAEAVEWLRKDHAAIEVAELAVFKLDAGRGSELQVLARSILGPLVLPRVSPKHGVVAFLKADEDADKVALEVITLDGRAGFTVARHVTTAFDWTPDGRSLVFMASIDGDGEKLNAIHRLTVVQQDGQMMKPRYDRQPDGSLMEVKGADRLTAPVTLATAITPNRAALQVLPDGRVLFASSIMTLPAKVSTSELESRLFVVSADGGSLQPIPTAPGDLPANLGYFVASPDGRRVAVVEAETDAVAVVEVDTGRTQIISPPHQHWGCRTIPAWKSAAELTFAALHDSEARPAWMLWSEGAGLRSLSEKWPAETTAEWLEFKKPDPAADAVISKPSGQP
jgi:hypothetical protein